MKNDIVPLSYALPAEYNDFLVIGGSLSHIQRFIYDTASKGALKNLRGRSFYLSLLTRAVCDALLHRLNLGQDSILYNSGGTFCIIAPTTYCAGKDIAEIVRDIKMSVAEMLRSDMLNIAVVSSTREELEHNCVQIFDRLFVKRHRAKFAPYGVGVEYNYLFAPASSGRPDIYESIGSKSCDISAILVSREKIELKDAICVDFSKIGVCCYLGEAEKLSRINNDGCYLLLINDEKAPANCSMPICHEFVAGNGARANSFEELFTDESSSHQRLAVLRMDVDSLGSLLRTSISGKSALSEYAHFSHRLDEYFKERINRLWRDKYYDSTVIIYAGGDDLFIVGEWEKTLSFMQEIKSNFDIFFQNKAMTLSGGVSLVKPKYPIIRAAEMSADEESMAKCFDFNGKQKDCISIFETPLRWEYEYKWIVQYKNDLLALIQSKEIDKSFVQHILRIAENIKYVNGKVEPIRYIWLAAYDLSRMSKQKRGREISEGEQFIKRCTADIMSGRTLNGRPIVSPYHSLQLITIAARFVEMTLWKMER